MNLSCIDLSIEQWTFKKNDAGNFIRLDTNRGKTTRQNQLCELIAGQLITDNWAGAVRLCGLSKAARRGKIQTLDVRLETTIEREAGVENALTTRGPASSFNNIIDKNTYIYLHGRALDLIRLPVKSNDVYVVRGIQIVSHPHTTCQTNLIEKVHYCCYYEQMIDFITDSVPSQHVG